MATYRDKAIVLRVKTLRDADRHYVVFTEAHGKLTLLAKGARKGKSKMSAHLSGFSVAEIMVARGKVIDRLAGASLVRPFREVSEVFEKSSVAQSFLLAVDALTKTEYPEERIFNLLVQFLETLEPSSLNQAATPALFHAATHKLMDILGVAPEIRACVVCRELLSPEGNALHLARGGMACAGCADPASLPVSNHAIKALRFYRDAEMHAAPLLALPPMVRREVSSLTEIFLSSQLDGRFPALKFLKTVAAL